MKKIFYLASIAALALSSCAKDDTTEVTLGTVGEGKITAAMADDADTRTYLDENQKFRWEGTDALAVYNNNPSATWNGTQFKMSAGEKSAVAVFNGPALNADYNHLAVYPWSVEKLFTGVKWAKVQVPGAKKDVKAVMPEFNAATGAVNTITMKIPATQEYYPGTFGNGTAPALSSTFVINKDGSADVSMQPVADYLFVDIKSTEPIKTVTLRVWQNNREVVLAGENTLTSYLYNGNIRYYMGEPATGEKEITLVTNERAPEVSCHEANTYVFVVPAGIFGMGDAAKVEAKVTVNEDEDNEFTFSAVANPDTPLNGEHRVINTQLNKYTKKVNGVNTDFYRDMPYTNTYVAETLGTFPHSAMPMENTYFYMNTKNDKGEVIPFEYNPNNDYIIEHEGQLLKYLSLYDQLGSELYMRDAFICGEHKFDFSIANVEKLSNELEKNGYTEFNDYFAAYIDGTFPCVDNYVNEFKGNGAVIKNIARPLESNNGIFGNICTSTDNAELVGTITDVTFSGINAKKNTLDTKGNHYYGMVLGSIGNGGKLNDVTVDSATGMAVLAKGNIAAYKELTVTNASNLNLIVADMDLEVIDGDFEIKNWDAVKAAKWAVFGDLDANGGHEVVKLPAGADYDKLAMWVAASGNATDWWETTATGYALNSVNIGSVASPYWVNYIDAIAATYANYYTVEACQTDTDVVSVLIGDESYWTGDFTKTTAGMPEQIGGNDATIAHFYKIQYAEQLAAGGADNSDIRIERNMNMGKAVNNWPNRPVAHIINGNKKVVKNINMVELGVSTFDDSYIAPVDAKEIYDLTVDGVSITIKTIETSGQKMYVPQYIGGLAASADRVVNVTLKNLTIAGTGSGANDETYYPTNPVIIGWLVANSEDTYVEKSNVIGVNNSIKGVAGLVGKITIKDGSAEVAGAHIKNSSASNVTAVQSKLGGYINWNYPASNQNYAAANFAGSAVAVVVNGASAPRTISLTGTTGKAVFAFNADNGNINALYGDGNPVQLANSNRSYWYW